MVFSTGAGVARAASVADDDAAQARLKQGTQAFRAGLFEVALEEFEAARALRPSARIEFNVGETLLALRRDPEAADAFDAFLDHGATEEPTFRGEAGQQLANLSARTLAIALPCAPPTYELIVDGQKRTLPHPRDRFRVSPGHHQIVVRRNDLSQVADERVYAGRGERAVVSLCLPPAMPVASPQTEIVAPAAVESRSWVTRPHILMALGAAAVLAAAAVVLVAVAGSGPPHSSLGNYPL